MRDARSRGCTLGPTHQHRTFARGLASESRRCTGSFSDKAYHCADGLRRRSRQSLRHHKRRTRVGAVRPVVDDKQHRSRTLQQRPARGDHLLRRHKHDPRDPLPLNRAAPDSGSGFNSRASVWSKPRTYETPCVKRSPWERYRLSRSSERVDRLRIKPPEVGQLRWSWPTSGVNHAIMVRGSTTIMTSQAHEGPVAVSVTNCLCCRDPSLES